METNLCLPEGIELSGPYRQYHYPFGATIGWTDIWYLSNRNIVSEYWLRYGLKIHPICQISIGDNALSYCILQQPKIYGWQPTLQDAAQFALQYI